MSVPENLIRSRLLSGKPTVATRLWSTSPAAVEAMATTRSFDYVEFLAEYSSFSLQDLENFVRAAELHGIGSIIKVDLQNRFYVAQRAAAAGFQGILFCDHKTPEEVHETIFRLSPDCLGEGRFGYPNSRWIGYSGYISQMDYAQMVRNLVKAFMIEKKEAVDNIKEICAIPGVDMIQFGPSDYSMSCGWNSGEHKQELQEIEEYVIRVALEHGVAPRCECDTLEKAEYYKSLGVRHFCIGDEFRILKAYWSGTCGDVRKAVELL